MSGSNCLLCICQCGIWCSPACEENWVQSLFEVEIMYQSMFVIIPRTTNLKVERDKMRCISTRTTTFLKYGSSKYIVPKKMTQLQPRAVVQLFEIDGLPGLHRPMAMCG